jgi:arylsulfatase A-like enzyme
MPTPSQPNLLILLCDQLRRDALPVYGDPNLSTPNLDRLAADGVRFDAACATYPICVPYRFTLMTGQYAHTRMIPGIEWRMSPAERTLADEFNEAGYETMYIGKWHLYGGHLHMPGYTARHEGLKPVPRHFQGRWKHWRGFELRNSPFDTSYFVDDDPAPRRLPGYQTDGLFDLGMGLIRDHRASGRPFACVVSVEPPHGPYEAPEDLVAKWLATEIALPPNFLAEDDDPLREAIEPTRCPDRTRLIQQRQRYYAMVENLDRNVGRMLDFLEREGLRDNTLVLFTSDHGDLLGAHRLVGKQHPYEESCGVPLLVAGPRVPAGRVIGEPVATEDLFPSCLGLCGLSPRGPLPGLDLSALIRGRTDRLDRPGVLLEFVSETRPNMPFHRCCWRAFRTRRFTYTVAGDLAGFRPWQFFDLANDPGERVNLLPLPEWQTEIARHHAWLRARMMETLDDAPLAPAFGCDGLNLEPPSHA